MILDVVDNAYRYYRVHPLFKRAFQYLQTPEFLSKQPGIYQIYKKRIFAIVSVDKGKGKNNATLEAHNRYIDIQVIMRGSDCIGWKPRKTCCKQGLFDHKKDCGFFSDDPLVWLRVKQGDFLVFFPQDSHAPLASNVTVKKTVIKVMV